MVTTENGLVDFIKQVDKYFMPNTFAKKMEAWNMQKKTEYTDEMTWEKNPTIMRKWRQDLASYGAITPEDIYCIVLLESSNLDSDTKL